MIRSSLDYIPVSCSFFTGSFIDSLNPIRPSNNIKFYNKEVILGYSCRSLFDTIMNYYKNKNDKLKILTTPIHHTSFRNIIEKYVEPENIFILEMNNSFNEIVSIPNNLKINEIDLCIISHMFGQDLKMDLINKLKKENKKIVGYGAPAKATTALNFFGITKQVEYIIEDNKLKHNKFVPGVLIPIKDKKYHKDTNSTILVLAWNFFQDIKRNNSNLGKNFVSIKDLEN